MIPSIPIIPPGPFAVCSICTCQTERRAEADPIALRPLFPAGQSRMATFYLLPPRSILETAFGDILARLLPGLPLPLESWETITDRIGSAAGWPDDVFLVPRDDLPPGESVGESLAAAFGAEPGDNVVEVSLARPPALSRRWVLSATDIPTAHVAL